MVAELLDQAAETDRAEDAAHGSGVRGDGLPRALAARAERLARRQRAKAQAEAEAEAAERRQRLAQRTAALTAAATARGKKPKGQYRPRRRDEAPRPGGHGQYHRPGQPPGPRQRAHRAGLQPQAAATTDQVIVAAEVTQQANDVQQLAPMLTAIHATLTSAGVTQAPQRLAADSGYWSIANVTLVPDVPELLIPPARHGRHGKPRKDGKASASKSDQARAVMRAKLDDGPGKVWYAQRSRTIEPVFGQVKTVQDGDRFMRRGLRACQAEWKLLCGSHNLLKLWRSTR